MAKIVHLSTVTFIFYTLFTHINGALNLFYPSFFTQANCSGNRSWTIWFNTGKPSSSTAGGDSENTSLIILQNPKTMCSIPISIHAQSINYRSGTWKYGWQWTQVTDIIAFVSFYSIEPINVDFQVRYCCPNEMIIETTTTTITTPIPLDNLICGKQINSSRISGSIWPWVSQ